MKKLLLSALALTALASSALAQQPPAPPADMAPPTVSAEPPPPPPPGGLEMENPDRPRREDAGRPHHGPRDEMRLHGHRPRPPQPSKAAHFRIEDGQTKIDLKCADDEPMKACAELLLQTMDRL